MFGLMKLNLHTSMCWWALIMWDWGRSLRPQAFLFNWSRSIFWIFSSIVKRVSLNFSLWSSQKDLQFMLSVMFQTFKKLSLMGNVKQSWVGSKAQEKKQPWIFLKTKEQRAHIRLVLDWCMLYVTFYLLSTTCIFIVFIINTKLR